MGKKTFVSQCGTFRYIPEQVAHEGLKGHFWTRWINDRENRNWVYGGMLFFKSRETRQTVERGFQEHIG